MAKFVGVIKKCVVCGNLFKVPQCRADTAKACSRECSYKHRMQYRIIERVKIKCACCGKEFEEHRCHAGRRRFCSRVCQHKDKVFKAEKSSACTGELNPSWLGGISIPAISKTGKSYSRIAKAKEAAKSSKRRAAKLQATPSWADPVLILAFYEEAQRISIETGIMHHVDHIVPLQSKLVCGLHTQENLCVMVGADNISKSNKRWPNMPPV